MTPLLWVWMACAPDPSTAGAPAAQLASPPAPVEAQASEASAPTGATPAPAPEAGTPDRIAASHILVSWQGLPGARVQRTRDEALSRIHEVQRRLQAGESFEDLARTYSDDPTGARGGSLGAFGHGAMVAPFEAAAFALPVGGTSDVVESAYGFHIIRRLPLDEVHIEQILVQWKGIRGAKATRSREEAQAVAEQALQRLEAGEPFESVARALSDGPMGSRGGDLGWFSRGQFRPAFEDAAFALQPGALSPVVETEVGFHVLKRIE